MNPNTNAPPENDFISFVDILQQHADDTPEKIAYRFLRDGEYETESLTYHALAESVLNLAAVLQEQGYAGQRALLMYHSSLDYVVALLACFSAGVIAVPAYPLKNERSLPRIEIMISDAEALLVLTTAAIKQRLTSSPHGELSRIQFMATDEVPASNSRWVPPALTHDAIAYLQYTSGSTGNPKGVIVTHGNLIHNAKSICRQFAESSQSSFVSWLPLFHDLGLIFGVLVPLYAGGSCTLMSPAAFLQRPVRWLKAISDYQATTSGAPNFAYELCVRRISENVRKELNLRSWRIALNGAEPVRASTLEDFSHAFEACGFHPKTHKPSYGLAEATLVVSCTPEDQVVRSLDIDPDELEAKNQAIAPQADSNAGRTLIASGHPFPDQTVLIVNPDDFRALPDRSIGEIWVSGASIANGYWRHPEQSKATFRAECLDAPGKHFLRTGDLGFLDQGDLFIAGRLKDVIILRGRNLYPQDIEATVEASHKELRFAGAAAFSLDINANEALVVIAELEHRRHDRPEKVVEAIREAVSEAFDVAVSAVELITAGSLPKTSSGKVQRKLTAKLFQEHKLSSIHRWENTASAATPARQEGSSVEVILTQEILRLLQIASSDLDPQKPLTAMGLDSLSAASLSEVIESQLGVRYPIMGFFGGMTLEKLVTTLQDEYGEPTIEKSA